MADPLAPWEIDPDDCPRAGPPAERLAFLVRFAILAPSGHNTQPWLFRIDGDVLELYADRRRALPVVDPDDRELTISCGAALAFLTVAMRGFGLGARVELVPEGPGSDLLARVRLEDGPPPSDLERRLLLAIPRRRTCRAAFEPRPLPDELVATLAETAEARGTSLAVLVEERERLALADLIAEGDRIQGSDRRFRRELAAWLHPNRSASADGLPGYAFGIGDLASYLGPVVIRTFDWGKGQAARDRQLAAGSPVLAVLGTPRDNPREWMHAGEALARVLLTATALGLQASYLNQAVEVEALRPRIPEVTGVPCFPQIVLRLGYGPDARPTPRRPLEEVLIDVAP
jgi:nitroreductase